MSNKILVEAPLILRKLKNNQIKEIASKLSLPDNNQDDLLFMSAILVSTGTNKNGATFLGSELIKARDSIKQKALDIEHEEHKIVGHIAEAMFMDFNGNLMDDEALYQEIEVAEELDPVINKLDKLQIDIGIVCIVYKDRFPQIAKEIEAGEWKVSMECYYDDYDLKIGNLIIPRFLVANKVEVNSLLDKEVKLVMSGKSLGTSQVSRVLRNVRFCGVGIVKNPANERSIILEAAKVNLQETIDREGFSACLKEAATLNLGEETSIFELPTRLKNEVVQVEASGYFIIKLSDSPEMVTDSFSYEYSEVAKKVIKLSSLDKSSKYVIVSSNSLFLPRESVTLNATSDAVAYSTDEDGKVVEIHSLGSANRETSYLVSKFGPKEQPAGICISFEKYVREFPGSPNPGRIVNTHWCKLFNKPCPVLGADAQDKDCLRSKFSRLVKDENIHGNALAPLPFNPTIDPRDTELVVLDSPPSSEESLQNKRVEGEPVDNSLLKTQQTPTQTDLPVKESIEVLDSEDIPPTPLPIYPAITKINPILDFPVQIASISLNERKLLKDSDFALPELKKYPINTENSVQSIINIFPYLIKSLSSYKEQKSLFKNTLVAALKLGLDVDSFEKKSKSLGFQLKPGHDYSEEYGIPRLKLFPLDSKEQVLAAMSRFTTLKADITDHERQHLVANILFAAKRFNIDTSKFCDRVKKGIN